MVLENAKSFYEQYGHRRDENWQEKDYDRLAADWKVGVLNSLVPRGMKFDSMVEFGCGSGFVLRAIKELELVQSRLVGIDLSAAQLAVAKTVVSDAWFIQGDESALGSLDGTFDLVVLADILEHVEEPLAVLESAGRLGRFVMVKIPLEDRLIDHLRLILAGRKPQLGLEHHHAGHLVEWNLRDAQRLLRKAKLEVHSWRVCDPPVSLRYHQLFAKERASSLPRRFLAFANQTLERLTCRYWTSFHARLYGTSYFALCQPLVPNDDSHLQGK